MMRLDNYLIVAGHDPMFCRSSFFVMPALGEMLIKIHFMMHSSVTGFHTNIFWYDIKSLNKKAGVTPMFLEVHVIFNINMTCALLPIRILSPCLASSYMYYLLIAVIENYFSVK